MTDGDRQVLIANCEIMLALVDAQIRTNQSLVALFHALERHHPNLRQEEQAARSNALFETEESRRLQSLRQRIDDIVQRLKREQEDHLL